jgi:ABC-type phosphate transport system substrate-binding protein
VRKRTKLSALVVAASTALGGFALSLGTALPAHADYAPGPNDVVGVGSDTLQYLLDFGDDGDTVGDPGYNSANNIFKVVSFDAVADSNSRAAYENNSTDANLLPLDPTIVIRAGTYPIQRPNGSGAGAAALNDDTSTSDPTIDFARMSSAPAASQFTNITAGVEVVTLGEENLEMAASSAEATNSPAGLSLQQLLAIYTCKDTTWTSVGGTSTDTIIPEIPQAGSGTRSTFLAQLATVNGGTAVTPGTCVQTVEENDPTAITNLSTVTTNPSNTATTCTPNCEADAIVPFSGSRLNLWNGVSGDTTDSANSGVGYFHNPTTAYPGGAVLTPGIKLLTGTPSDSNPVWDDVRQLYVVYPWADQQSTTPWQPGSKLNWAQALFCDPNGPAPWFDTAQGLADISQAGATPDYSCAPTPLGG